ncbi:MAG TPA: S-methyl-5'-thioadenosine phosphorylase [Bacteroidales bacterium]|nr:S-methyl-5'-thioadenosine phosphorylase [Bacteroidales bacterium]
MIGIIGGTGLEKSNFLKNTEKFRVNTEYGEPSSEILTGYIENKKVAIISRHGSEHTITPTHVNNRANISALKDLGCKYIIATSACGSLREEIKPGDFVIPDQFIDFTKHRTNTFYDSFKPGEMQHCPMSDPFSAVLRTKIEQASKTVSVKLHTKGTILTIEGPRFSTRSESLMFRSWGADIINMSTAPETALANEAGIPYAVIAISTDYDCWKMNEEPVSIEIVLQNFAKSVTKIVELLHNTIKLI